MTKADDEMLDLQNLSLRINGRWREWAPLGLRLVIGYGFMAHGLAKLLRGPERFAAVLDWMHVPFSHFMAWFTTWVEILGGLAILVGAFVTLVTVPLIIIHLVAIFGVHLKYGFSSVNTIGLTADGPQFGPPGYEVNLLYIAGLVAIVLCGGAGRWSLDRALAHRWQRGHGLNDYD